MSASHDLHPATAGLIEQFVPISLAEMDAVALLNRIDLKYMLSPEQLLAVLAPLAERYRVLSVQGVRLSRYRTHYFDTPDFYFYHQHHNGGQNRYKVRVRTYVDSDLSFLEVKQKNNQGRTIKSRLRVADLPAHFDAPMVDFLQRNQPFAVEELEHKLSNDFTRITLVSTHAIERLTIDLGIRFAVDKRVIELPDVVVAEVKHTDHPRHSDFVQQMRAARASQFSFSKYCIGAALHHPQLKQNNFKPVFLYMRKLGATPQFSTMA